MKNSNKKPKTYKKLKAITDEFNKLYADNGFTIDEPEFYTVMNPLTGEKVVIYGVTVKKHFEITDRVVKGARRKMLKHIIFTTAKEGME